MMRPLLKWIVISAFLSLSISANSEDAFTTEDVPPAPIVETPLLELAAFEDAGTLSDDELNKHRAREEIKVDQITLNNQDQDGDVTDNVAIGNTNGDNVINGQAFSDSSGFLSSVQNTGNNVLIQNSTIINVSVETPSN
ncbi:MAG: hypothetical protein KJO01_04050 [Gammaproteobacteria bacterium]|nr:hypothetical protein [Gammaproteobacteria bacterium]